VRLYKTSSDYFRGEADRLRRRGFPVPDEWEPFLEAGVPYAELLSGRVPGAPLLDMDTVPRGKP